MSIFKLFHSQYLPLSRVSMEAIPERALAKALKYPKLFLASTHREKPELTSASGSSVSASMLIPPLHDDPEKGTPLTDPLPPGLGGHRTLNTDVSSPSETVPFPGRATRWTLFKLWFDAYKYGTTPTLCISHNLFLF